MIEEPILKGEIPYYAMDEVDDEWGRKHGLIKDSGRAGEYMRFYWLTPKIIVSVRFSDWPMTGKRAQVWGVLELDSLGTLQGLGVEGLLRPECQDAIKAWTVLARMQETNNPKTKFITDDDPAWPYGSRSF